MKETIWGYWIIMLGVFVAVIMMLISNVTTQNTQEYYLIKEVTEAAMIDSINLGYYRKYGELKIDREKFVESFLRRFAENVSFDTYQIDFYDIYEAPPKVSVKVTSKSRTFRIAGDSTNFDIVNKVDAILEVSGEDNEGGSMGNDKEEKVYTVHFSVLDGMKNIPDQKVVRGNKATKPANPVKAGCEFVCFNKSVKKDLNLSAYFKCQANQGNLSLYDYILSRATTSSTGYYDCTSKKYCEKTTKGNIKYFACSDYTNYNKSMSYDACTREMDKIYNSLPDRIKK